MVSTDYPPIPFSVGGATAAISENTLFVIGNGRGWYLPLNSSTGRPLALSTTPSESWIPFDGGETAKRLGIISVVA
jgi:hypothetical protein